LSGQKWCINFATFGQAITLLCRSHEKGGLRGFSLFHLNKRNIQSGFSPTPKLPTHGVRGLDISGFRLENLVLPKEAIIGKEHRGLEVTYKTLQVSRTLCASLATGGMDSALRITLSFVLQRQLYGKRAYDIPVVKQKLGELFVSTIVADCVSLVVARACTIAPEYLSLWSAIIKYLVPKLAVDVVEDCGIIMGARGYLRGTEWGMFQKIRRDIQIVGLFDGSSQVNLSIIAGHLLSQAENRHGKLQNKAVDLNQLFNMQATCPEFKDDLFSLYTSHEDAVLAGVQQLRSHSINKLIELVNQEIKDLDKQVLQLRDTEAFEPQSLISFRLADQYCRIFAASCCLLFWHHNQKSLPGELKQTGWLQLAVPLLLAPTECREAQIQERMSKTLLSYFNENKLFSLCSVKIQDK
jgi:hypothetical protein